MRRCQSCVAASLLSAEEVVCTVDEVKKKDDSDTPKLCAHCNSQASPGEKLVRCSACSQVSYCGRQCQQAHWPSHKAACLQSRTLSALTPKKGSSDGEVPSASPPQQAAPEKARPTGCLVEQPDDGAAMKKDSAAPPPRQCAQCGSEAAPGEQLVQCSACGQVCYCTRMCQKAHWCTAHKAQCPQFCKLKLNAAAAQEKEKLGGGKKKGLHSHKRTPPQQPAPEKARPSDRLQQLASQPRRVLGQSDDDDGAAMKKGSAAAAPRQCAKCGSEAAPDEQLVQCSACGQVCYCDRLCQKAHWRTAHRAQCPQFCKLKLNAAAAQEKEKLGGGKKKGLHSHKRSPPQQPAPEKARPSDRLRELASQPRRVLEQQPDGGGGGECAICLCCMAPAETASLPCGHRYHTASALDGCASTA